MKASTVIVSALATLVAAAPTEKKVEERGFNDFLGGGFNGFPSTNVNYLFGLNNGLNNFNILQQLALNQNFGFNQFDGLFNANNQFLDLNTILQLQQLSDLAAIAQLGVFGGFDLAQLNLQNALLQTGLLNLGGANLGQFVQPNVVTQVQTIASQVIPGGGLIGSGFAGVPAGGVFSGAPSAGVSTGVSSSVPDGAVTAAEQDAQEGGGSLSRA